VQNCCKGRSSKCRKWHFWGRCRRDTPWPIDTKLGLGDYDGDETQYPKLHVNWFRGLPTLRGEMLMVCAFYFVCSLAQLGAKPLDWFWRVISQKACFCVSCIPLWIKTTISQFYGAKIPPKNTKNWAWIGIFQPKCQTLATAISPKEWVQSSWNLKLNLGPRGVN